MTQADFDRLTVLCLAPESREGHTELCQDPTGLRWIRLYIQKPALQKTILIQLPQHVSARMTGRALELLLPWQDGETLTEWLYNANPDLGQRRDMCLSLLSGLIGSSMPPDLIALSAQEENLRFSTQLCTLQLIPNLTSWHFPLHQASMVQAVALLVKEILTRGLSRWDHFRFPDELRLISLRCEQGDYTCWETLQQDLTVLPEALNPIGQCFQPIRIRLQDAADRYGFLAARILVGGLAIAALLSLASAVRVWHHTQTTLWPGMTTVGSQILHREEGNTP